MHLHPSTHVGDAWYYVQEDTVHCFYLTTSQYPDLSSANEIGHAVSTDLLRWKSLDLALRHSQEGREDEAHEAHRAVGSVLYYAERYWLAYTASMNILSKSEATVCLAVSDDLMCWQKVEYNPVTRIDPLYYQRYEPHSQDVHWCSPFLFYYDEWVYHYVCACRRGTAPEQRGTLGLARTQNMIDWEVLPAPIFDPILRSLDVPQLYHVNGLFYLVFFAHAHDFAAPHDTELASTMYSMVSPTPFGPFRMVGSGRIIPASASVQLSAAQIIHWHGQHYLLCNMRNQSQNGELQPMPVQFTAAGVKAHI